MLRGIIHGMKWAAPLLVLASASQLLAADTATKTTGAKPNTAVVAPLQSPTTNTAVTKTPANPTGAKATTNQQTVRRYHRHHRRGYGRRYVGNTQTMPRQNVTAAKQFNNSKSSGKVATQPVKHHNTTTQRAPKNTHKTSHKQAKASHVKKA